MDILIYTKMVDNFKDVFEKGKTYIITNPKISMANK